MLIDLRPPDPQHPLFTDADLGGQCSRCFQVQTLAVARYHEIDESTTEYRCGPCGALLLQITNAGPPGWNFRGWYVRPAVALAIYGPGMVGGVALPAMTPDLWIPPP